MSYSNHYLPPVQPSNYYSQPSHVSQSSTPHTASNPQRTTELPQRKRPKYTRSKTGCLTCRVKKVKCDESKPICVRCAHGQRDCTWPEGVSARKKSSTRKDSIDGRSSTADSSGLSDTSTPPTREHSPPRRSLDLSLLPLPSRRISDSYDPLPAVKCESDPGRLPMQLNPERGPAYGYPSSSGNMLSTLHEPYPSRYDHAYASSAQPSRQPMSVPYRSFSHHDAVNHWHPPSNSMDSYYQPLQERTLLSHSSPNESHNRYQ